MNLKRPVRRTLAFLFAGLVLTAVAAEAAVIGASEPAVGVLNLSVGDIATASLPNLLASDPASFDAERRFVIQLDGPMTPERRAALADAGVVLSDYLPTLAYVAELSQVDPARLAGLGIVRWVGEYRAAWKLDPELGVRPFATQERQDLSAAGDVVVLITLFEQSDATAAAGAIEAIGGATIHTLAPLAGNPTFTATLPLASTARLATIAAVQYVEPAPEITLRNSSNRWIVQSNQVDFTPLYDHGLRGEGQIIGIIDTRVDRDHCSFSDINPIGPTHRKIEAYNASAGASGHGTHVAGTAVGDGGVFDDNRGVAYLGRLVYNTIPAFNEPAIFSALALHHDQGARIHTNSWGDDGTTAYNGLTRGIDAFSHDFEDDLVLLAVTNTSTLRNPENAKNLLAVGASFDAPSQDMHSSGGVGPTSDGRRKPEIYAPGRGTLSSASGTACSTRSLSGTSMACPAVAGTGMLVRQYYLNGFYPTGSANPPDAFVPSGALIKATLLNSAVDMTGVTGYPSDLEGWGRVRADGALFFGGETRKLALRDTRNADGLSTGELVDQGIQVAGQSEPLRITLVWTDPPAAAGAAFAAVNDLDLEVTAPNGTVYLGNVFVGGTSAPGGVKDDRNNVEQVHVENPSTGEWTVRISAAAINVAMQGFALVVTGDVTLEPVPFSLSLPNGVPQLVLPGAPTDVDVRITPGTERIVVGSETVFYRYDGGVFQSAALTPLGGENYVAMLPAADCGDTPEFYVQASGDGGTTLTFPSTAPSRVLHFDVGRIVVVLEDNFEEPGGWTVENVNLTTGAWIRAVPISPTRAQEPPGDFDGSGKAWVTGNAAMEDVDGGPTVLTSSAFDLSAANDPEISYARWVATNDPANDPLVVEVSDDDGVLWTPVEQAVGGGGWLVHTFRLRDFVTPTALVRLRFSIRDNPNNSVTEAAIDALKITDFVCSNCPADLNGDGVVDLADVGILLADFGCAAPGPCSGDIDGDGDTDLADLGILLSEFGNTCP